VETEVWPSDIPYLTEEVASAWQPWQLQTPEPGAFALLSALALPALASTCADASFTGKVFLHLRSIKDIRDRK